MGVMVGKIIFAQIGFQTHNTSYLRHQQDYLPFMNDSETLTDFLIKIFNSDFSRYLTKKYLEKVS